MNRHPIPTDPEGRQALAGEYVLGTLDARSAAAVREAVARDAELRAAVEAWEDRLTPLASAVPQEAPPPDLWARIEAGMQPAEAPIAAAIGQASVLAQDAAAGLRRAIALWRAWAIGASAAAAALAAVALVQTDRTRQLEANLRAAPQSSAAPGSPAPSMLAVQPPAASEPPVSQLARPTPPAPLPGQPQVMQATSPAGTVPVVKPASTDASVAQPSLAPPQGAPIQVAPVQNAPGAVVTAPASGGALGVRPASGSEDGAVIRR